MTIQLFMFLFTIGSTASSLMTETLKKFFKDVSSNVIALANAFFVGIVGTVFSYILMGIEFNVSNVVCIALMSVCIAVGSMVGYDKVMQTISQLKG